MNDETVIKGARSVFLPALAGIGGVLALLLAAKLSSTDAHSLAPKAVLALAALVFGPIGLLGLLKPRKLRLGKAGFTLEPVLGPVTRIAWSDVEEFRSWTVRSVASLPGSGGRWIAWSWRPQAKHRPLSLKTSDGVIGAIPGQWSLPVGEILALMHDRLEASRA